MWVNLILFGIFIERDLVGATEIVCENNVTITLDADDFSELEVTSFDYIVISQDEVSQLSTITNERCKAAATSIPVVFNMSGMYDCDPYIEVKDEFISVTWIFRKVAVKDPSQVVIRFNNTCFNRTCRFRSKYFLNSSNHEVSSNKKEFGSGLQDGLLSPVIGIYDNQFVRPQFYTKVPNFINVEIRLNQIDESVNQILSVQITDCWLNLAEDSEIEPQFPLIDMNCKSQDDPNELDNIIILRNFQPNYARFKFRSFFFSHRPPPQFHYIHCEIRMCNNDLEPDCTADQCNRKRRHVSRVERSNEKMSDVEDGFSTGKRKISFGPIGVYPEKRGRTCKVNNGGCSDVCIMNGNDVTCDCRRIDEMLLKDQRTCAKKYEKLLKKISHHRASPVLVIALLLLAVVTFVAFYLLVTGFRRRHNVVQYSRCKL